MRPEELARWNELAPFVEHHRVMLAAQQALSPELLHELEEYWQGSVQADPIFDPRRAVALLLQTVKSYEAALLRIVAKPEEQETLMKHREQTGQEVPDSDEQRYFAYLKVAHIAAEALGTRVPVAALKNLEREEG